MDNCLELLVIITRGQMKNLEQDQILEIQIFQNSQLKSE